MRGQIDHGMLIARFGLGIEGGQGLDFMRLALPRGEVDVHKGAIATAADGSLGCAVHMHPLGGSAGLDDLDLFDRALSVLAKERQWYFFHGQGRGSEEPQRDESKPEELAENRGLGRGRSHAEAVMVL